MIRAAVIGVGSMGKNHARVFAEMEETELVAVADPVRAERVARIYRATPYADHREMLEKEELIDFYFENARWCLLRLLTKKEDDNDI